MQQRSVRRAENGSARKKGIAALAIGGLLLAGGGGSLAYWSTQESVGTGTISTGDLNLTLGAGDWKLQGAVGAEVASVTPSDVKIVPGDVLILTQELSVTLVGDTIEADLSVDSTGLMDGLPEGVTVSLDVAGLTAQAGGIYRLTPDNVGQVGEVTVTVDFSEVTAERISTNKTFDLSEIAFSLVQAES